MTQDDRSQVAQPVSGEAQIQRQQARRFGGGANSGRQDLAKSSPVYHIEEIASLPVDFTAATPGADRTALPKVPSKAATQPSSGHGKWKG